MTLSREDAAAALGVDAYGLERLIALGEIETLGAEGLCAAAVQSLRQRREIRRAEALRALAHMDGPHL